MQTDMNSRKTYRADAIRHPFNKKKLRVLDVFIPKDMICPVCGMQTVDKIMVVESEAPGGVSYHIVSCLTCNQQNWFVFLN